MAMDKMKSKDHPLHFLLPRPLFNQPEYNLTGQKLLFLQCISRVIACGRLQSTDRARNTTCCWTAGLLESSACRLPGQSALTRRRPYTTAISRKVVGKKSALDNPKSKMGYEQYTVLDDCRTDFSTRKHLPMASRAILSNFFEEQGTQNDPKYLSGLSRALFFDNLTRNSCI